MDHKQKKDSFDIDMCQFLPDYKVKYENVPDFKGPIQIVENVPGKGRGIIATEDIPTGQLVILSKAFEIIFHEEEDADDQDVCPLTAAIAKRITKKPRLSKDFYELHAGKELQHISQSNSKEGRDISAPKAKSQCKRIISQTDLDRIKLICQMNSFESSGGPYGIWILPSYINHDCIDFNCVWTCLGDLLFIRTVRNILKDEELLISYTKSSDAYEKRLGFFEKLDFICECRLCLHQKAEDVNLRKRKCEILQNVEEFWVNNDDDVGGGESCQLERRIEYVKKCLKEFQEIGVASGKPEWNFGISGLFEVVTEMCIKSGDFEAAKATCEEFYKIINKSVLDCGASSGSIYLEHGTDICMANSLLECKDFEGTKKWVEIIRKDLSRWYGKSDVLKWLFPDLFDKLVRRNLTF